jgi:HSP20 family protein
VASARWDQLGEFLALQDQLGQLVGSDSPGWTPPVDLFETLDAFILTAEVPGLTQADIDVRAEESRVTVRGERSAHVPCEQYHRVERGHGRFSRTFSLPESIDVDQVTAELKDGLLTLTMPKAAGRGSRKIRVG